MNTLERISETGRTGIWSDSNRINAIIWDAETYSGYSPETEAQEPVYADVLSFSDEALSIMADRYDKEHKRDNSGNEISSRVRDIFGSSAKSKQCNVNDSDKEYANYNSQVKATQKGEGKGVRAMKQEEYERVHNSIDKIKETAINPSLDKAKRVKMMKRALDLEILLKAGKIKADDKLGNGVHAETRNIKQDMIDFGAMADSFNGRIYINFNDTTMQKPFSNEQALKFPKCGDKNKQSDDFFTSVIYHEDVHRGQRYGGLYEKETYQEQLEYLKATYDMTENMKEKNNIKDVITSVKGEATIDRKIKLSPEFQ